MITSACPAEHSSPTVHNPVVRATTRWTPERRARHIAMMKKCRPWARSTGPRTPGGKAVSSQNAWKHGARASKGAVKKLKDVLLAQDALVRNLMRVYRFARIYRYYVRPGFREVLQKHILSKGLDGQKKITTNELFSLARCRGLIAFPKRLQIHKILAKAGICPYNPDPSRSVGGCSGPKSIRMPHHAPFLNAIAVSRLVDTKRRGDG